MRGIITFIESTRNASSAIFGYGNGQLDLVLDIGMCLLTAFYIVLPDRGTVQKHAFVRI